MIKTPEGPQKQEGGETPEELKQEVQNWFNGFTGEDFREGSADLVTAKHIEGIILPNQILALMSLMSKCSTQESREEDLEFVILVERERQKLIKYIEKYQSRNLGSEK